MIKRYWYSNMGMIGPGLVIGHNEAWVKYSDHIEEMDRLAAEYEVKMAALKTELDRSTSCSCSFGLFEDIRLLREDNKRLRSIIDEMGQQILILQIENDRVSKKSARYDKAITDAYQILEEA